MRSLVRYVIASTLMLGLTTACADSGNSQPTTRPASVRDRQDAALKDPFGYGESDNFNNEDKVDISGGDLKTLDKKALKRDLDAVFNP